jgi:hypothetical protein
MRIPLIFLAALAVASAEVRPWKSADGTRSFDAEYISQDGQSVVLRRVQDQKVVTVPISNLHASDHVWLAAHKAKPAAGVPVAPGYDDTAVFDTLHFGDTRAVVEKKLRASRLVELTVEEALLGRFGLNGSFRTRKKIGGLACVLSFGWTEEGGLKEVTLQSDPQPVSVYPATLKSTWEELANLMTVLHGKPVQEGVYPASSSLQDGMFIPSHLWKIKPSGSAVLGASRDGKQFQIVVRLTDSQIKPVQLSP